MIPLPTVLKLARRLEAAWAGRAGRPPDAAWRSLDDAVAALDHARRRSRLAADKKLTLTAPALAAAVWEAVAEVRRRCDQVSAELSLAPPPPPGVGEWVREVRQLEDEFDTVEIRGKGGTLRVVTEPVVLEDVDLGQFAIDFAWDRAGDRAGRAAFEVVALNPHPAAGRPDTVHPHVEGKALCAGDAGPPIDRAVAAGRLADAFLLVRSVLTTYNPSSPYVPLAEWGGFPCGECGRRADPDDRSSCEGCEADLCDGCVGACANCFQTRCGSCLTQCEVCRAWCCPRCLEAAGSDRSVCPDCRKPCPTCSTRVPADELSDGGQTCPSCDTPDEEENPDDATDDAAGVDGVVAAGPGGTS